MMQPTIFGGNTGLTYDQIQKQRDIANELLRANMSTPQNVGEGLSAIGRALAAKAIDKRTTRADEANKAAYETKRADIFGSISSSMGGASPASYAPAPGPGAAVADDTMSALGKTPMRPYRDAIASIESAGSGDYAAVGPTNPQLGRALGRYQIMEANIGPWSKAALGREVTPDEFLANPQLQDAIFDAQFGQYVQQYGPEGAAQAWFAGPGGVGKMDRQDVLGTSVADYTQKFAGALGGTPAQPQRQSPVNPAILMQLAEIQGNPYASESDKAIANVLMGQVTQAMDPMRQMEMERARLELDALKNPQPGFTTLTDEQEAAMGLDTAGLYQQGADGKIAVIQEPKAPSAASRIVTGEDAKALGLDPALRYNVEEGPNGVKATPIGGGQTVNRTDPAPPAGFRNVYNEQGLLVAQEPIPGSPAAQEAEAAKAAQERAAAGAAVNEETRSNVVLEASGKIRKALDGGGLFDLPEVGIVGNALKGVNQEAADVGGMLETLKGMVVFDRLEKLKQASATGASGLGQVTEREIALLGSQLGALEQNLSKPLILSTLDTVESVFGKLSPQAQAYLMGASDQMPQGGTDAAAPPPAVKNPTEMSDEELLKALGQ